MCWLRQDQRLFQVVGVYNDLEYMSFRSLRLPSWDTGSKAQVTMSDSGLPSHPCLCPLLFLVSSIRAETWTSFQVLLYNGQLDIIVAASLTERSLMAMNWSGSREYKRTHRKVWKMFKTDNEVAGYVRRVGKFHQVCKQLEHTVLGVSLP